MNIRFDDKVILVVGAYSGIGNGAAKALKESGATVVMADVNPAIAEAASALGEKATGVVCDVADEAQVAALVEGIVAKYGRLDGAYNNVGVQAPVAPIDEADGEAFDRTCRINLRGMWNCLKYEIRQMKKQGRGAIVNCSSQCGIMALAGLGAYVSTKHGVVGLTKVAALETARSGIRVNAICPGSTDTLMVQNAIRNYPEHMAKVIEAIPMGRIATVAEIVSSVQYLLSDQASFVTGVILPMDGGCSLV